MISRKRTEDATAMTRCGGSFRTAAATTASRLGHPLRRPGALRRSCFVILITVVACLGAILVFFFFFFFCSIRRHPAARTLAKIVGFCRCNARRSRALLSQLPLSGKSMREKHKS